MLNMDLIEQTSYMSTRTTLTGLSQLADCWLAEAWDNSTPKSRWARFWAGHHH